MTTFSIFAARDGETYRGTVEEIDEEAARIEARGLIAQAFRMSELLDKCALDDDLDHFDAELDGFTLELLELAAPAALLDNKRQSAADPMPLDVDREGMNDDRASWALAALEAFQAATGTDDCDAIGDLIADLAHLCDREGERFGWSVRDKIERGLRAYEQEITDEEPEEIDAAEVVGAVA